MTSFSIHYHGQMHTKDTDSLSLSMHDENSCVDATKWAGVVTVTEMIESAVCGKLLFTLTITCVKSTQPLVVKLLLKSSGPDDG